MELLRGYFKTRGLKLYPKGPKYSNIGHLYGSSIRIPNHGELGIYFRPEYLEP